MDSRGISKKDGICRRIIEWGIIGLIIFSPLPAASVNEWSIFVIEVVVAVMAGAYFLISDKPQSHKMLKQTLKVPKVMFIGLMVFLAVQILPLPIFLVKLISPGTYHFHQQFSIDPQNLQFLSLSVIPAHTLKRGLEFLSYFLLGFLVVKTVTSRKQILRLVSILVGMGIFQALYGLFELYHSNPRLLFYSKIYNFDSATGTFVNRNHFSGYLEMILPLAVGLVIARIDILALAGLRWREKLIRLSDRRLSKSYLMALGIVLMALAVIFSKSRSGAFLLLFSFFLFFAAVITAAERDEPRKLWVKRFLVVTMIVILLISLQIGIGASLERFALDELLLASRPIFWANTVGIFSDYPIFGAGLGTFPEIYPDWEGENGPVRLYHAHNDYLEFLAEMGVVGFILLFGSLFFILITSFLAWRARRNSQIKGLALGGIISMIMLMVHSLTDFNLQIPANQLLFAVIIGLTLSTVHCQRRPPGQDPEKVLNRSLRKGGQP